MKAKLGMKKVRPWKWMPFTNPARKDGAVFHHWRRVADEGREYPFAKFNKVNHVYLFHRMYCSLCTNYFLSTYILKACDMYCYGDVSF